MLDQHLNNIYVTTATYPISRPFKHFWMKMTGISWDDLEKNKELPADPYEILNRTALEQLGDWGRSISPVFWLNALEREVNDCQFIPQPQVVIVPDVRVDDEANWIRERGVMIHVTSNTLPTIDSTHTVQSQPVQYMPGDILIENNRDKEFLNQVVKATTYSLCGRYQIEFDDYDYEE